MFTSFALNKVITFKILSEISMYIFNCKSCIFIGLICICSFLSIMIALMLYKYPCTTNVCFSGHTSVIYKKVEAKRDHIN